MFAVNHLIGFGASRSSIVAGGTGFGAMVKLSGNLTSQDATGRLKIPFDAEVYDSSGWHDTSSNNTRLTVGSGISYVIVQASIALSSMTADLAMELWLLKSTGGAASTNSFDGATGITNDIGLTTPELTLISGAIPVTAGDYFELEFNNATDTSITINAVGTYFSIMAVG